VGEGEEGKGREGKGKEGRVKLKTQPQGQFGHFAYEGVNKAIAQME